MIPLTPAFLIAAATSFVGLREEGSDNRGLMIDLFLKGVGQPVGQPWCAAFVHHVGYWSHYDFDANASSWPLPATASCYVLGDTAREKEVLRHEPMAGDVFLLWSPSLGRFAHTGVVARVRRQGTTPAGNPWSVCDTIEGNTNDDGGREGWGVLRRVRHFDALDKFIRWADLDDRPLAGNPLAENRAHAAEPMSDTAGKPSVAGAA
jgi:hypothetical protein